MLSHIMPLRPFLVTRGRILLSGGRHFEANVVSAACRFAHRFGPWASCYWCSCLGHPMPFSPFPAPPSNASPKEIQAFACRHYVATVLHWFQCFGVCKSATLCKGNFFSCKYEEGRLLDVATEQLNTERFLQKNTSLWAMISAITMLKNFCIYGIRLYLLESLTSYAAVQQV